MVSSRYFRAHDVKGLHKKRASVSENSNVINRTRQLLLQSVRESTYSLYLWRLLTKIRGCIQFANCIIRSHRKIYTYIINQRFLQKRRRNMYKQTAHCFVELLEIYLGTLFNRGKPRPKYEPQTKIKLSLKC